MKNNQAKQDKINLYMSIHDIHGLGGTERVVINLCWLFYKRFRLYVISYCGHKETMLMPLPEEVSVIYLDYPFEKRLFEKLRFNLKINALLSSQQNIFIAHCNHFFPFVKKRNTTYLRLEHYDFKFLFGKYIYKKPFLPRVSFFDTLVILSKGDKVLFQKINSNVVVIPNFLPTLPKLSTNSEQKRVISVGRMDKGDQKGFLRLIDIWNLVQKNEAAKDWQLIIVGDGELKEEIESKILSLNLQDSITLKPFTKDIESQYLQASIYVMASHFEGLPMVLLESCSYGLCPVSFDIATGPSDIIDSGSSGYLVEDNDLQGFSEKILELMTDSQKRETFGKNAKQKVAESFSKEAVMKMWEEAFKQVAP